MTPPSPSLPRFRVWSSFLRSSLNCHHLSLSNRPFFGPKFLGRLQPDRHRCSGELRRREPVQQQQQQQTPKSHQLYLPAFTPTLTPTHPTDMSHSHTSLCHWMFLTDDSCCNALHCNGRLSSQGVAEHMCAHLSQVNAAVAKPMSSNLSETSCLKRKKKN